MDEQNTTPTPAPQLRRRRKTKTEIFKEAYLPYIILMAAALLIIIFIIGALVRNANKTNTETLSAPEVSDCCEIWTI